METRINKHVNGQFSNFKCDIKNEILKLKNNIEDNKNYENINTQMMNLLQFVLDYEINELTSKDYAKRKRAKNNIPLHEQCIAKKSNGSQCTRRKKTDTNLCGTHIKGRPHGEFDIKNGNVGEEGENKNNENNILNEKKVEVWLEDIGGIMHYIDNQFNIYDNNDIIQGVKEPKIIAKYEKTYLENDVIMYKYVTS